MWNMLKFIKSSSHLPWVCVGHFNEVLHQLEHVGVLERSSSQIAGFQEMVDVCGFHDLGFEGRSWTFEKKVAGGSYCRVRLDRALASPEWSSRFPAASVHHLSTVASDHIPILMQWHRKRSQQRRKGRFRYEIMWETHQEFSDMLEQTWKSGGNAMLLCDLQQKLQSLSDSLVGWEKHTFGHVHRVLQKLEKELGPLAKHAQSFRSFTCRAENCGEGVGTAPQRRAYVEAESTNRVATCMRQEHSIFPFTCY